MVHKRLINATGADYEANIRMDRSQPGDSSPSPVHHGFSARCSDIGGDGVMTDKEIIKELVEALKFYAGMIEGGNIARAVLEKVQS